MEEEEGKEGFARTDRKCRVNVVVRKKIVAEGKQQACCADADATMRSVIVKLRSGLVFVERHVVTLNPYRAESFRLA